MTISKRLADGFKLLSDDDDGADRDVHYLEQRSLLGLDFEEVFWGDKSTDAELDNVKRVEIEAAAVGMV